MGHIDIAYFPIVGRGMQINIICKMHEIDANFLISKPMGEDFDKDTQAPFGTVPWLKDNSMTEFENLPEPDELALDIIENIELGLNSFKKIAKLLD